MFFLWETLLKLNYEWPPKPLLEQFSRTVTNMKVPLFSYFHGTAFILSPVLSFISSEL